MEIGKLYTFNTTTPSVLGDIYSNMHLVGSGLGVLYYKIDDIQSKYDSVSHVNGVDRVDANAQLFHQFIDGNHRTIIMADGWINKQTLVETGTINISVQVNNITLDQKSNVLSLLESHGYDITLTELPI